MLKSSRYIRKKKTFIYIVRLLRNKIRKKELLEKKIGEKANKLSPRYKVYLLAGFPLINGLARANKSWYSQKIANKSIKKIVILQPIGIIV